MNINHKQYLDNPKFYGSSIEAAAIKVEQAIIDRSWCTDDGALDRLDYAVDLAQYELFKLAGDACLKD